MESPTDGRKFPEHGRGRPVWPAAILLLTTVAAIVLAASLEYYLRPKPKPPHASTGIFDFYDYYQHGASLEQAAGRRAVTGAVIGLIVGIVVALRRQCWPAGLVLALFLARAGAWAAVPLAEPHNLPVALVGAAVLLALGIAVRGLSKGVRS